MKRSISLLLLCAMLLPMLSGCTASADQRMGEAKGYGGVLKVSVTMSGDDITKVKVTEHHETQGVGTRAIDALPAAIEKADSINVDSISGATVTSNAIKEAVSQAIGAVVQPVIPMTTDNATQAASLNVSMGAGMASTGRVGPGKDEEGGQVYSFNVVFAAGEFEEDGTIRRIKVDQLEVVTPNLGSGNAFAGFPSSVGDENRFMEEVSAWQTKGAMGDAYKMPSGSWREQMNAYEQMMVGMTVEEIRQRWGDGQSNGEAETASETESTTAADAGTAQPVNDMASVPAATSQPDAASGATMSLTGEHGDILLAIERAWEDARRGGDSVPSTDAPAETARPE